jgi:hypothetical protein
MLIVLENLTAFIRRESVKSYRANGVLRRSNGVLYFILFRMTWSYTCLMCPDTERDVLALVTRCTLARVSRVGDARADVSCKQNNGSRDSLQI